MRLLLALRCFFLILFQRRLPPEAAALLPAAAPSEPAKLPPAPSSDDLAKTRREAATRGAVQLLALFQREGRLIDFLEEDITSYADAQVGAAVRDIHKGCKRALAEHVHVEPVLAQLDGAPATDLASLTWYTVRRGDTLPAIARKLHVSSADLAEANYLPPTARVAAGQKLMVPHEASVLMAARTDRPVPAAEARRTVAESGQLAQATDSNRVKVIYQVKRGDTLASIARLHKTTIASLKTWNPRLPDTRLTAGQRLTLYRLAN